VIQVREARPEEFAEVGRVTQAAWAEFARPEDPVWEAYFDLLGNVERRAADVGIAPETTLLGYRLSL